VIRSGYDQTFTINLCRLRTLYQGDDPNFDSDGRDATELGRLRTSPAPSVRPAGF